MFADLAGKHVLLLQGPMGPFFRRLARELQSRGTRVTKINFNAGDALFYAGKDAIAYRGNFEQWPGYVEKLMIELKIDAVMLFGDCRPYHCRAMEAAQRLCVPVYVFEEGYLRPDFITVERGGVNGSSRIPQDPDHYRRAALPGVEKEASVENAYWYLVLYTMLYAIAATLFFWRYPRYRHHCNINAFSQALRNLRGVFRKILFGLEERKVLEKLKGECSRRYFLFPLQVHDDYQLTNSRYQCMEACIREVVASFARRSPPDHLLVIKHHPLDRAYCDYSGLVKDLARSHGLQGRLLYVHDLHLPTLIKHARGAVMINSTVGLSCLHHGTPVKVLGKAVYDLPGLTCQGDLAGFWLDPGSVDTKLYRRFRRWLRRNNQANGSFYRRLPGTTTQTGIRWFSPERGHLKPEKAAKTERAFGSAGAQAL
jgi:capsule polysaccharide modification protein KpsS